MDKKIYSYIVIMYIIKASSASQCTVRNDGNCYYTVNCDNPAEVKTVTHCNNTDPYVTLVINNTSVHNVTRNFFNTKFDAYVRILTTVGNSWDVIQNFAFSNFKNVLYMDLSGNYIKSIGKAFSGLGQLDSLNLSRNHLEVIDPGVFNFSENKSRLYLLDLSYNLLTYLPGDFFGYMKNLRHLYLQGNKLTVLEDKHLKNLKNLNYLNFCCSNLAVNLTLKYLPSLRELDLSYNRLENVDLSELMSLETINLSHNNIEEMKFEYFKPFLYLEHLDLSFNKLTNISGFNSVSSNITKPLVKIHLNHNNISYIDETFFSIFSYIHLLDLSFNEITKFQPGIFKHVQVIKVLRVPDCRIEIAQETLENLDATGIIGIINNDSLLCL